MSGRFSISGVFKAIDRFSRPVARMQSRTEQFTRSMQRGFRSANKMADRFGRGLRRMGIAATAAGAAASAGLAGIIRTGADFEQQLINAAAKFPDRVQKGTAAFQALEDAAKTVGANTEHSATAAAQALDFLAMAGFNSQQAIAALPGVVDLATAAQVQLGSATDIASDALGAFGLMTQDATQLSKNLTRVSDVMARTTTASNTTMAAMFEAIKEGGPVATSAGASIETFSALVGEMANAGIKGGQAGTTLKNVFLRLAAPAGEGAAALRKLGIATKDGEGNMRDIIGILGDLERATKGMGTADRAGILESIFGKIPIAGVNVLLKSGADQLGNFRRQLEAAGGASKKMAGDMRDSTANEIKGFKSALEAITLALFDVIKAPVRRIVGGMTEWARANREVIQSGLQSFLEGVKSALPVIAEWAPRILRFVGVFAAVAVAIKVASAAMAIFNAVMAANPVTLVAIAIVAALALIVAFWPEISGFFSDLWDHVKAIGASIASFLSGVWDVIKSAGLTAFKTLLAFSPLGPIVEKWEPIKAFFTGLWDGIVAAFDSAMGWILSKLDAVSGAVRGAFDAVGGFLGFGGDEGEGEGEKGRAGARSPNVVHPATAAARELHETMSTERNELTIRDETGRAAFTRRPKRSSGIHLEPSGAL